LLIWATVGSGADFAKEIAIFSYLVDCFWVGKKSMTTS
jgi:hypothetical protein